MCRVKHSSPSRRPGHRHGIGFASLLHSLPSPALTVPDGTPAAGRRSDLCQGTVSKLRPWPDGPLSAVAYSIHAKSIFCRSISPNLLVCCLAVLAPATKESWLCFERSRSSMAQSESPGPHQDTTASSTCVLSGILSFCQRIAVL